MIFRILLICGGLTLLPSAVFSSEDTHIEVESDLNLFESGVEHFDKQQYYEAFEIFLKLAKEQYPEAQYNLSLLYSKGVGVPINYKSALYWGWIAHLNGHDAAQNQNEELIKLITVELRDEIASQIIEELTLTASAGNGEDAFKLAVTLTDLATEPNFSLAYSWMAIAQAFGVDGASDKLELIQKNLDLETILQQQNQAAELFSKIKDD